LLAWEVASGEPSSTSRKYANGSLSRRWQLDVKLNNTAAVAPPL
jgi:hypothetical protein